LAWKIEFACAFERQLVKLDKTVSKQILRYLTERGAARDNPREMGRALTGDLQGRWRYRVGDHRVICEFLDDEMIVLALNVGHRKEIYH